jgi:hypothetical protein
VIAVDRDTATGAASLPSPDWLTWWFEPWRYAHHQWWNLDTTVNLQLGAHSIVSWRRSYRSWCQQFGLPLCWTDPIDEAWCSIARPVNPAGALRLLGAAVLAAAMPGRRAPAELSQAGWQWALQCASTGSLGKTANVDDLEQVALEAIDASVRATSPCLLSRVMLVFPPALVQGHRSNIDPFPVAVARRVRRVWAAACSRSEQG